METNDQAADAILIKKILEGDVDKFEILIRKYSDMLYKITSLYDFNESDAEKLIENTFVNAYKNLSAIKQKKTFKRLLIDLILKECVSKNKKILSLKQI